ncbi:ABC transporter permease, partial [Vibrio diabolicus]
MKELFKLILGNSFARIGLGIVTVFVFVAIAAPLLTKHAPDKRTGNPHEYPSFVVKQA